MVEVVTQKDLSVEQQKKKRGFTLTEIAIVLGIIGLILGAIWVAAGAVYQNLRVSKAQTELLQITQAIRTLYATQTVVDTAAAVNLTSSLIAAKVFPSDAVLNATTVNGPWGGSTMNIYSQTDPAGVTGDSFSVEFDNIPVSACIALATGATGSGRDQGLIGVANQNDTIGNNVFPINVVAATQQCQEGTPTSTISFTFTLRGD